MKFIELIILANITIHITLIEITSFILSSKINKISILLSSLIDIIYTIIYLLNISLLEVYKYPLILLISIVSFIPKNITKLLSLTLTYLLLNFLLGGTSKIISTIINYKYSWFISLLLIVFLLFIYILKRPKIKEDNLTYDIYIKDEVTSYYLKGYLDTGNFLSYNNIPIIIVSFKPLKSKYIKTINIETLNGISKLKIYDIKEFKIKLNKKYQTREVYIAYSNLNKAVIFGKNLLRRD